MDELTRERSDFYEIDCICCGTTIKLLDDHEQLRFRNNENKHEYDPITQMWNSGTIGKIDSPYGSIHDGNVTFIAICDDCLTKAYKDGRAYYAGDYIGEVKCDEYRRNRQKTTERNNNINQLTPEKNNESDK